MGAPALHGRDHRPGGADSVPVVLHVVAFTDADTVTAGDGARYFAITDDMDGCKLFKADASVSTVSSSGALSVMIRNTTAAADMLSTAISIDASEFTSYSAGTRSVINPSTATVSTGDMIAIDVDSAGSGAKGLTALLSFGKIVAPT